MNKKSNKKYYIIAVIIMLLMYISLSGNYINKGITNNRMYLYGLMDFLGLAFFTMIGLIIIKLAKPQLLDKERGWKTCLINVIVALAISIAIYLLTNGKYMPVGFIGAIIFYIIDYLIFVCHTDKEESNEKIESNSKITNLKSNTISDINERKHYKKDDNNYVSLDIFAIVLIFSIIIIASLIIYIVLNNKKNNNEDEINTNEIIQNLSDQNTKLSGEKIDLELENMELKEKAKFLDNNIVFVIDGYGKYYYTYDQMIEVTRGKDQYYYSAYNIEAAIGLGYRAYK